ncbi:PTS sugar transporter subunit IIA [Motilimonas cestriensis]|uniref:PTS sugar transporter subunit IIA n=1 Tax=Motilimonas cestriensis TaxID=2742685 RepID=A0ABS8WCQ5_9GAMM|nr:PTS sugar transporter subunit IIA [Motilimonas cestriensis]MCE2596829.1 PTS sugar transporter subunit IIA [Motilimonas cestriensis]
MSEHLISQQTILLDFAADSKTDALYKICAHLFLMRKTQNPAGLYDDIIKREAIVSTFAGQHTAIPHVISSHVSEPVLCFVRLSNQDFVWNDNDEDVRIIFFLSVPEQKDLKQLRESQSHVFSSIAQLMQDTHIMDLWLTTNDEQVILDSLKTAFQSNLNKKII